MYSTAGIPRVVLDAVISVLISSMKPLPLESAASEENSVTQINDRGIERRTFWSMCLVHPSWTDLARGGLWYRVIIRASDVAMLEPSLTAANCLRIRELALIDVGSEDTSYIAKFVDIVFQSSNLRKLYLDLDLEVENPSKEPGFSELLRHLLRCSQLESLWSVGEVEVHYQEAILTISSLPCLKTLVLYAISPDERLVTGPLPGVNPPKSLKSVAVLTFVGWENLSWFVRPRDDYHIGDLAISIEDPEQLEEDQDPVDHLYQCLLFLRTLHLSTDLAYRDAEIDVHNECLGPLLAKGRNLQHFTLTASMLRTPNLQLPHTVNTFHLHHVVGLGKYLSGDLDLSRQDNDQNIAATISMTKSTSPPKTPTSLLGKCILSFTGDGQDIDYGVRFQLQNELFAATYTACQNTGVTLVFETYASPVFGTFIETGPFVT